jgi:hypothetical protein
MIYNQLKQIRPKTHQNIIIHYKGLCAIIRETVVSPRADKLNMLNLRDHLPISWRKPGRFLMKSNADHENHRLFV